MHMGAVLLSNHKMALIHYSSFPEVISWPSNTTIFFLQDNSPLPSSMQCDLFSIYSTGSHKPLSLLQYVGVVQLEHWILTEKTCIQMSTLCD